MNTSEYLEKTTKCKLGDGEKPTMLDLCDKIKSDEHTPDEVLLAIVGKALIRTATNREWLAFKWLASKYAGGIDQAIEIRTFVDTHHS